MIVPIFNIKILITNTSFLIKKAQNTSWQKVLFMTIITDELVQFFILLFTFFLVTP